MSIGYNTILKLRRIEEECAKMGFRITTPPYSSSDDRLSIVPANDALPLYARDAILFTGNLDELSEWLSGAQWMHDYYTMLKLISEAKIKKKEDDIRCDNIIRKLKANKVEIKE